jgi:hypothetical protein
VNTARWKTEAELIIEKQGEGIGKKKHPERERKKERKRERERERENKKRENKKYSKQTKKDFGTSWMARAFPLTLHFSFKLNVSSFLLLLLPAAATAAVLLALSYAIIDTFLFRRHLF